MRPELEQIEKIEQYLNGELSPADFTSFEAQLAAEPALREAVRLQQDLRSGLQRIMHVDAIKKAKRNFYQSTWLRRGGLGLGGTIIIAAVTFLALSRHSATQHNAAAATEAIRPNPGLATYSDTSLPAVNEKGEAGWAAADRALKAQTFWLYSNRDTVITTKGGIVLSIPAQSFIQNNHAADGTVELTIKEALDPASIIKAGLSTRSGDRPLETGGMFFLDARKSGQTLTIDPKHAIYAEIPTDSIKSGMQLFSGKRLTNGTIDWINPKPLERNLVAVDIQTLSFYPPGYLDLVAKAGFNRSNKIFTDSLYYSFARLFSVATYHAAVPQGKPDTTQGLIDRSPTPRLDAGPRDSIATPHLDSGPRDTVIPSTACGINPAKIKAIWNNNFNNTLIATRQFEERLNYIHRSGDSTLLDLYVTHLNWDLFAIDSLAALHAHGEFKKIFHDFALRHDGHVLHGDTRFDQLSRYYHNRSVAYTEAIAKTQREFWDKQAKLDEIAANKQTNHDNEDYRREAHNFRQELKVNLDYAFTQLGYDTSTTSEMPVRNVATVFPVETYSATIYITGWCNVDRYTEVQTSNRQTIDFTDANTGKRAVIKYQQVSFQIRDYQSYDRVTAYLLPDKVSSFMRLDADTTGIFSEKLNALMNYRLVIIGYKQKTTYSYMLTDVQPSAHRDIPLTRVDRTSLETQLNGLGSKAQSRDLIAEQDYLLFIIGDQVRQHDNKRLLELSDHLLQALFPCAEQSPESEFEPGKQLFVTNCAQCHTIRQTLIGPALAWVFDHRDPIWLHSCIRNYHKLMASGDCLTNAISKTFNNTPMPIYPNLTDKDIDSILTYITNQSRGIDSNTVADYKRQYPQCGGKPAE